MLNINEEMDIEEMAAREHIPEQKAVYILVDITGDFKVFTAEKFSESEENRRKDYFSILISVNKSVDKYKKIQSCNKYTLFTKVFCELTDKIIEEYYKALCEESEALKYINWINANKERIAAYSDKYIKIFFPASMEEYELEGKKYLNNSIFCDVRKIVIREDGEALGVPLTINLNSKKPYLLNNTRKVKYPTIATKEECYNIKCILDLFKSAIKQGYDKAYLSNNNNKFKFVKYNAILNSDMDGTLYQFELNSKGAVVIKNMATVCFSSKFRHNNNTEYYYPLNELFFEGDLYKMLVEPEKKSIIKNMREKKIIIDILRLWFLEGNPPVATLSTLIKALTQMTKNNLGENYDEDIQKILFIKKLDV